MAFRTGQPHMPKIKWKSIMSRVGHSGGWPVFKGLGAQELLRQQVGEGWQFLQDCGGWLRFNIHVSLKQAARWGIQG